MKPKMKTGGMILDSELKSMRLEVKPFDQRLTALEEHVRDMHGYAKEIDVLRADFRAFEMRLRKLEAR